MMVNDKIQREESTNVNNLLLAVALLMGFIFIVSVSIYFIKENYGISCSCRISLPIVIAVLTSLGVFVGILTYYFFSKSYSKEKEMIFGNVKKTLNFLDKEEKSILLTLISNGGLIAQNELSKATKIDAVKLYRRLLNLESKFILHKVKKGMTNQIVLNDEFKVLFLKGEND